MEHKKWIYVVIKQPDYLKSWEDVAPWLDLYGQDGWELISIEQEHYIFKRPILSQQEQ